MPKRAGYHVEKNHGYTKKAVDRRGSSHSRGYTHRWRDYSAGFRKTHQWCIACVDGLPPPRATMVDHLIPVRGPTDILFWAAWNHQPLCSAHHRWKTNAHDTRLDALRSSLVAGLDDMEENAPPAALNRSAANWRARRDLETLSIIQSEDVAGMPPPVSVVPR